MLSEIENRSLIILSESSITSLIPTEKYSERNCFLRPAFLAIIEVAPSAAITSLEVISSSPLLIPIIQFLSSVTTLSTLTSVNNSAPISTALFANHLSNSDLKAVKP